MKVKNFEFNVRFAGGTASPLDPTNLNSHTMKIRDSQTGNFCNVPVWHKCRMEEGDLPQKVAELLQTAFLGGLSFGGFQEMMRITAREIDMQATYDMAKYVHEQVSAVIKHENIVSVIRELKANGIR